MRAAVYPGAGQPLRIEEQAVPVPLADEVVIKVCRCGVCGTDLHATEAHSEMPAEPGSVLGHEYTGEVVETGRDIAHLKLGDRIAVMPLRGCGRCADCAAGRLALCLNKTKQFGGYAQFARVQELTAVRLPADLSLQDGALVEPLAVSLHGVAMAGITPGCRVTVLGAGPIGAGAAFWARHLGAGHVTVIERLPPRQRIAQAMGADRVLAPEAVDPDESASDVVFEAVGRPGLLGAAMAHARIGATVVSLGFCMAADPITPAMACRKELTFKFPTGWSRRDFEVAADVLAKGTVEPRAMLTDVVGMDELPQAFEALRRPADQCKVVVDPWG